MGNLIVEIGNTAIKAALSEGKTLGKTFRYQGEKRLEFIKSLAERENPEFLTVASASELTASDLRKLKSVCSNILILDPAHADFLKEYSLPEYLSCDRAASIIAARSMFPGKPCTIFDFGTTVSIDFIDSDGSYSGGNISLGMRTRFKALARYSRSLPLVNIPEEPAVIGSSAETSIEAGTVSGIMFEIQAYSAMHQGNMTIFTGGDANYFAKRTKNSIFVVCNLVLMGLALITDDNVKKIIH